MQYQQSREIVQLEAAILKINEAVSVLSRSFDAYLLFVQKKPESSWFDKFLDKIADTSAGPLGISAPAMAKQWHDNVRPIKDNAQHLFQVVAEAADVVKTIHTPEAANKLKDLRSAVIKANSFVDGMITLVERRAPGKFPVNSADERSFVEEICANFRTQITSFMEAFPDTQPLGQKDPADSKGKNVEKTEKTPIVPSSTQCYASFDYGSNDSKEKGGNLNSLTDEVDYGYNPFG